MRVHPELDERRLAGHRDILAATRTRNPTLSSKPSAATAKPASISSSPTRTSVHIGV